MVTIATPHAVPGLHAPAGRTRTHGLLAAAALAGPLFYVSSTVQALTRQGFDIRVHPLSQLATGGPGWIQQVTFVLAGLGVIALAVAHRRLITHGAGAPEGVVEMSWHSIVHTASAAVSFIALAGACISLLVRSIRRRRVGASLGHGLVALVLLLPMSPTESSIQIAITGLIAFTWVTVSALRLRGRARPSDAA